MNSLRVDEFTDVRRYHMFINTSQETSQLGVFISILIINLVKNTLALLDSFNHPPSETVKELPVCPDF